ncbi:MAG: NTP transferase domain-containing protein [Anaerolineales bacterium]|nr:NTP transferase domain-containing protein [Anaerolineales bacterium]MBN2676724.1 NTP transferase domain-containing protein [Anaerolineaceae bacterium]
MKAVILAGGKGTRLAPYTYILPKPLMPIGDMPILEILILQMKRAGINEIILTVGHLSHLLRAYFENGQKFGVEIRYSLEDQPLGTAGPLSLIEDLDRTFIVSNGDVLCDLDIVAFLATHQQSGAAATIAMYNKQVNIDLGVLKLNGENEIIDYLEKPSYNFPVSMGLYAFEPRVLQYIPRNHYLDFPDLVLKLLEAGETVRGYDFDGYWRDLGRKEDYEQAIEDFETMRHLFLPDQAE